MKVKDLMATEVKCCAGDNTLNSAAQLMWDYDIGCVPVIDNDRRIIGMLTDRDICMAAYIQGVALGGSPVTSAMSKQVFACAPDDEVAVAEKLMRDRQVRRLPVLDGQGRLAGIISLNDIARQGAHEAELKKAREVTDAEIAQLLASACAPRQRIIEAQAA
jgi:CBS domain-containing protein